MIVWVIVAVVVVAMVAGAIWLFSGGDKIRAEHEARFEQGTHATATIKRVEQPGTGARTAHVTTVLRLYVTVAPPDGEPYDAVTGVRIKTVDMPRAQPGETLPVRIANDNPKLVYPDADWAEMELVTITRAARGTYDQA